MPVPHPYDNTARHAVHAVHAAFRAQRAERGGAMPTAPRTNERPGRAPVTPAPVSETAVSQADGEA